MAAGDLQEKLNDESSGLLATARDVVSVLGCSLLMKTAYNEYLRDRFMMTNVHRSFVEEWSYDHCSTQIVRV